LSCKIGDVGYASDSAAKVDVHCFAVVPLASDQIAYSTDGSAAAFVLPCRKVRGRVEGDVETHMAADLGDDKLGELDAHILPWPRLMVWRITGAVT
jgi:hypothetical protein